MSFVAGTNHIEWSESEEDIAERVANALDPPIPQSDVLEGLNVHHMMSQKGLEVRQAEKFIILHPTA